MYRVVQSKKCVEKRLQCGGGQHGVQEMDCLGGKANSQCRQPAPDTAESSSG